MKPRFAVAPLLLPVLVLSLWAQQSVSPVASSEANDVVPAFSSSGAITLPAIHLQLDLAYASGKRERRDLALFFDPQNGYYLWHLAEATAPGFTDRFLIGLKSHRIYADADGIFDFVSRGYIWVKVSTLRAANLKAAKRAAIEEIEHGLPNIERGYVPSAVGPSDRWPWDRIHVSLPISSEFTCGSPARADCPSPSLDTITLISKVGNSWRLVLRNHWDQEAIMDSGFKVLSTQRLEPPQ